MYCAITSRSPPSQIPISRLILLNPLQHFHSLNTKPLTGVSLNRHPTTHTIHTPKTISPPIAISLLKTHWPDRTILSAGNDERNINTNIPPIYRHTTQSTCLLFIQSYRTQIPLVVYILRDEKIGKKKKTHPGIESNGTLQTNLMRVDMCTEWI